jgi:type IV pilus assembly protein PilA
VKGPKSEAGFTLIELLIVIAIIGIIASIGIASVMRARVTANETAALSTMRAINGAQTSYSAGAGLGGFATTLTTLGAACPGSTLGFISPDLDPSKPGVTVAGATGVVKSGYTIDLAGNGAPSLPDCNGTPTDADYLATAVPLTIGVTGVRGFNTSAAATIYFDPSGLPTGITPLH